MSKVSQTWNEQLGTGKALNWPAGIGAKGNPGVSGTISQSAGTIGYIGFEYAFAQNIPMAQVMNKAGNFIEPTLGSFTAAASTEMPADTRIMITNSSNPEAYPITSFTWIIMYKEQGYADRTQGYCRSNSECRQLAYRRKRPGNSNKRPLRSTAATSL